MPYSLAILAEGRYNAAMTAKPKRRWYQFSLKTLLVVLTLFCIGPGGYVAYEQAKARRQKAEVEAIERFGGQLGFDREVPFRSATIRQILGDESFGKLSSVSFTGTEVTDADLVRLGGLTNLVTLDLDNTQVTDTGLVHLAGMTKLKTLLLGNTAVTDASLMHLANLRKLEGLSLYHTQVTDAGLVHLASLNRLTYLDLHNTHVTDAGVAELQETLPNCRIVR